MTLYARMVYAVCQTAERVIEEMAPRETGEAGASRVSASCAEKQARRRTRARVRRLLGAETAQQTAGPSTSEALLWHTLHQAARLQAGAVLGSQH